MKRRVLWLFGIFAASACAYAPEAPTGLTAEDEEALRAIVAEWNAAWATNDKEAAVALYTDDYMEARATAVRGREAALEVYRASSSTYSSSEGTVLRIEGSGDVAHVFVEFTAEMTNAAGEPRIQRGHTLWTARKQASGEWLFSGAGFAASTQQVPSN